MYKVVWLCHFSNKTINEYFNSNVGEIAPWINLLLELFKENKDFDLHVVSPNVFNNKDHYVKQDNITYHFYKFIPGFIPKKIYLRLRLDFFSNFFFAKKKIKSLISRLCPDIIHLHGAENPYYSAGILPLMYTYNSLITIQGFVRNASANDMQTKKRIKIEEKILRQATHFGVRTKEMYEIIFGLNPSAQFHSHEYPCAIPNLIKVENSEFDLIFFARVTKDKGIEDLIEAVSIIKKDKKDISLKIIGAVESSSYKKLLDDKIDNLNISENVEFLGFLPTQNDIYSQAIKAKICVLPTYHDTIPGTIIESMFMKLPVISYSVGGIPELNSNCEAVRLVEKKNIYKLSAEILNLLNNNKQRVELAENAYKVAHAMFDNNKVVSDLSHIYKTMVSYNEHHK